MKKIMLAGFGQPLLDLFQSLNGIFKVIGIIPDYNRRVKDPMFYKFFADKDIPIYTFKEAENFNSDAVIVVNYNRIIDLSNVSFRFLLNIHLGLLPTYRGNNANAWAILNGERKVGYTIHEVSKVLDGGKIYYKFVYEIEEGETYFHAKKAITEDLVNTLPGVIEKIINEEIYGISQENETYIYASKLIPEDGILNNWNYLTKEIINRYIIFSRPLGTGLKIKNNNQIIEISKLSIIENFQVSCGIVGAVVMRNTNGSIWIKTKDTAISIDELIIDENIVRPSDTFKIGDRL